MPGRCKKEMRSKRVKRIKANSYKEIEKERDFQKKKKRERETEIEGKGGFNSAGIEEEDVMNGR